jgi:hypothetical protein
VEEDSPPGKRSLDDIDTAIMKRLLEVWFSWKRTLGDDMDIRMVTIWQHMTKSFGLKYRVSQNLVSIELTRKESKKSTTPSTSRAKIGLLSVSFFRSPSMESCANAFFSL